MRYLAIITLLSMSTYSLLGQDKPAELKGVGELEQLNKGGQAKWFVPEYDHYKVNIKALNGCREKVSDNIRVIIVMGTWCPDSRREVPRFYKVLDNLLIPEVQTKLLFVDHSKDDGIGEAAKLNIQKVPTFIVTNKRGKEIGRIIEEPTRSLEKDLCKILNKETEE
jgi:thiol-disulfide isomerase/thioredoxin